MTSKTKKKHLQRKKNAMQRSETVWSNKRKEGYFDNLTSDLLLDLDFRENKGSDPIDLLEQRFVELAPENINDVLEPDTTETPQTLEELQAKMNDLTPFIHIDRPTGDEGGLTASCTCGEWIFGPTTKLSELGTEAKKHREETGHKMRGVR